MWTVTAYLWCSADTESSCAEVGAAAVQVSSGQFSGTIFSYVHQVSVTATCSESVSVQGTLTVGETALILSGNELQAGDCINGGNGFSGYIEPPYDGTTIGTSAGWLKFVRGNLAASDGDAAASDGDAAASAAASDAGEDAVPGKGSSSGSSSGGGLNEPCWECCCVTGGSKSCGGSATGPSATCPMSCPGTCATGTMQCVSMACNMP